MRRALWLVPLLLACSETTAPDITCTGTLEVVLVKGDTTVYCVTPPPDTVWVPPDTVYLPPDDEECDDPHGHGHERHRKHDHHDHRGHR